MVVQNFTEVELLQHLIENVSSLTTFFQAIGGLIILYFVFNVINLFLNRKKNRQIKEINENLKDIKKLLSKKK